MSSAPTPEQLVDATAARINGLGASFYFHPATLAVGKELGLDGFRFYILGRGGVLGDVEAPVITSAFGYFHPDLIAGKWDTARAVMEPRPAGTRYLQCNADLGRAKLTDVDPAALEAFCDAAAQVVADVNPAALALYAGLAAEPVPDDLPARALHYVVLHRELRGSQHLAAIIAHGMHPAVAHALRRPNDIATFGWPEDLPIPDDAAATLATIDATTNRLTADTFRTLSDDQRSAYAAGVDLIESAFA